MEKKKPLIKKMSGTEALQEIIFRHENVFEDHV